MTRQRWILAVSLLFLAACGGARDKPVYVDVRTTDEFAAGHVQGALNIPHDQMEQRWRELSPQKDQRVVVYCRSGRRSALAIEVLQQHGFSRVENGGGLQNLVDAGVPLEP